MSQQTGIAPNASLSARDLQAVAAAITVHEGGVNPPARGMIDRSAAFHTLFAPNPAALAVARGVQPTPAASPYVGPPTSSTAQPSNNVQIDSITVNTQASDANRMAADMDRAVRRKFLVAQFEPGLV